LFIPKNEEGTGDEVDVVVDELVCGAGTGAAGAANKAGDGKNKIKIKNNSIAVAFKRPPYGG
jgi:hypothetical protein